LNCIADIDCTGVCGGNSVEDECGVCGGDGPEENYNCEGNCLESVGTDCFGVCGGVSQIDVCGNCDGGIVNSSGCDDSGCMDSDACNFNNLAITDNGSCVIPPEYYNCEGECISFLDCNGVCGGPLLGTGLDDLGNDECGVCEGLGAPEHYNCLGECTSGVDCNGACGGPLLGTGLDDLGNDECGVCEGLGAPEHYNCLGECTSGVDCNGACGGTSGLDECGVCDGDGLNCMAINPNMVPDQFNLFQNYPNPFNPATQIRYDISQYSMVSLKIYDITGRLSAVLFNEHQSPGQYSQIWNGSGYSSGLYFLELNISSENKQIYREIKKILFIQ